MINNELHLESTSATKFGVLAVIFLRVEAASFRGCSTTASAHRAAATAHRATATPHRAASTTPCAATHSSTTLSGTATLPGSDESVKSITRLIAGEASFPEGARVWLRSES